MKTQLRKPARGHGVKQNGSSKTSKTEQNERSKTQNGSCLYSCHGRPNRNWTGPIASYGYDLSGNITTRTLDNGTSTSYTIDNVNRLTNITHNLVGGAKRFDYAYNAVNDITAVKRDGALGDGFTYDLNQQIIGYRQNGTVNLGAGTVTGGTLNSLAFDGCGNSSRK